MKKLTLIFALLTTTQLFGAEIFDDDSTLQVKLTGPLSTLLTYKRDRKELPFSLTTANTTIDISVRVRGKSRAAVCRFPPLRLKLEQSPLDGKALAAGDKLKLVTHCQNGSEKFQDSVLNEFTAYRIFNLISERSYRVRLLRIRYEDTDGKQRKLDEPHYGFLIESDESLAKRLGGTVVKTEVIRFSELDAQQTARLSVFNYLIGNKDWSLVKADSDDTCCHNIDLLKVDEELVPIPYDFDLAALTRARYRADEQLNQSKRRTYTGYCRTPEDILEQAVDRIQPLADEILATAREVPALAHDSRERRATFIAAYFEEALDKASLLAKFNRRCIGKR